MSRHEGLLDEGGRKYNSQPTARGVQSTGDRQKMPTHEETLKRLATTFTVKDVMVPRSLWKYGKDEADAIRVSKEHPDFDVIPIIQSGDPTAYFERDSGETSNMRVNDLISDGTSLIDLVEILERRKFSFVLSHESVNGYVHYSDLNHDLVKLTFYVLLEALQKHALASIGSKANNKQYLEQVLGGPRSGQIEKNYKDAKKAGHSLSNYLNISDILRLAISDGVIELKEDTVKAMKHARDGAAHVLENLVSCYSDVNELAQVKREAIRILGSA
jgi:hypothetical protein